MPEEVVLDGGGSVAVESEVVPEGGDGLGGEQEPLPGLEPAHVVEVVGAGLKKHATCIVRFGLSTNGGEAVLLRGSSRLRTRIQAPIARPWPWRP